MSEFEKEENDNNYINNEDPLWARLLLKFMSQVVFVIAVTWATLILTERKDTAVLKAQGKVDSLIIDLETAKDSLLTAIKAGHAIELVDKNTISQLKIDSSNSKLKIYADSIEQVRQLENKMVLMQGQLQADLVKIDTQLSNALNVEETKVELDRIREINTDRMRIIKERLSNFYWPILIRLEKNQALVSKYDSAFLINELEQEVLLDNHIAIEQIIENQRHLAFSDRILDQEIQNYLAYVSLYKAMQAAGYPGDPSLIGGDELSPEFHRIIDLRAHEFQSNYDSLLKYGREKRVDVVQDFDSIYQVNGISMAIETSKSESKNSLIDCFNKYFINQSKTNQSFFKSIDNTTDLILKDSKLDGWAQIEVEYAEKDGGNKKNKRVLSKRLQIGQSAIFYFPNIKTYYKVTLNRIYKTKRFSSRNTGDFTVNKWRRDMETCDLKEK